MITRITKLILLLSFVVSCTTKTANKGENKNGESLTDPQLESIKTSSIDTSRIIRIVADDILKRLNEQQIRKSDFNENGDYYIEFNEDTTNSNPDDIVWEYYQIEKGELITGRLNDDDKMDFAVRSTWGPTIGNIFGLEWHLYVSDSTEYKRIKNDFGGGKYSDLEKVKSIDKLRITTEFQELDEETAWLKDSVQIRKYNLVENELKRTK